MNSANIIKNIGHQLNPFDSVDFKGSIGTLGKNGLAMSTAIGTAFAVNADSGYKWQLAVVKDIHKISSGLYVNSDWSSVMEDAKGIKSISAGIHRKLDVKWLLLSLNEHKGGLLTKKQFDDFKETMQPLSILRFVDCHVAYRTLNNIVRITLVLEEDFRMSLTYFVDREGNEVAFSLDFQKENIISGHGTVADVAKATMSVVNEMKKEHGRLS